MSSTPSSSSSDRPKSKLLKKNSGKKYPADQREKKGLQNPELLKSLLYKTKDRKEEKGLEDAAEKLDAYIKSEIDTSELETIPEEGVTETVEFLETEASAITAVTEVREGKTGQESLEKPRPKVTTKAVDTSNFKPENLTAYEVDLVFIFQLLYQQELLNNIKLSFKNRLTKKVVKEMLSLSIEEVFKSTVIDRKKINQEVIYTTIEHLILRTPELDQKFIPFLKNWSWDRLSKTKQNILRLAGYLIETGDKSPKFVVNEMVKLAKWFGEEKDYQFVNAILEAVYLKAQQDKME